MTSNELFLFFLIIISLAVAAYYAIRAIKNHRAKYNRLKALDEVEKNKPVIYLKEYRSRR